jgi:hypothetical protein
VGIGQVTGSELVTVAVEPVPLIVVVWPAIVKVVVKMLVVPG